jgi:cell division protein FtsX
MSDLRERLLEAAEAAARQGRTPGPAAAIRRGHQRRRRQLAGSALLVAAVVAAGVVLPSHLAGRTGPDPAPAAAPPIDVRGAAMLGGYWFGKTDATVLLGGGATRAERESVRRRLQALDVVDRVYYESKAEAYARIREQYRTRPEVTRRMTIAGMADGFRVRLDAPEDFPRLQRTLCPRSTTRRGFCLDRVEVVEDLALVKTELLPERWATSSDLSVFLPAGTTDAGREAVRARLEAVGGVARVTYESPAEAYRRLPEWLRRNSRDRAAVLLLSPEMMRAAFRVALDEPARVREVHRALCGSRRTGACPGVLVVLEHPRR